MTDAARGDRDWILAIRLRQLGDVLAALGPLQAVRAHDPRRAVALVVDAPYEPLLRGLPFIDRVLVPPRGGIAAGLRFLGEIRALGASATLDFHGSARSALMTLASGARVRAGFDVRVRRNAYTVVEPRADRVGGVVVPRTSLVSGMRLARHVGIAAASDVLPRLPVSPESRDRTRARWIEAGVSQSQLEAGRVVGLNPGRPVAAKRWPVERFAQLARELAGRGYRPVIFWGPGEEEAAHAVVAGAAGGAMLAPGFALADLPAALAQVAALVTIDSGLKHLAVCVRTPTITLFGPTDPREWHMGAERDRVLWKGLSCSPCRLLECPFGSPCMDVSVDAVLHEVQMVLKGVA